MAERPVTAIRKGAWLHFSWDTVTDADTCQPIYVNHNVSDILMQVSGTFSSAVISMTGGVTSSLGVTGGLSWLLPQYLDRLVMWILKSV
jgi:hypothetical protein